MNLFNIFFIISQVFTNGQMLVGSQRDDHGCVLDGGYQWCESTSSCERPWETPCPMIAIDPLPIDPIIEEPGPVIDEVYNPCSENQVRADNGDCISNIPSNCATWFDGCNTCQVRDGRADMCTLMYCFTLNTPYCMHFTTEPLQVGDICYRFCEDGSQESINRRDDCPGGTECISVFNKNSLSMVSYDSCGDRAMTCEYSSH